MLSYAELHREVVEILRPKADPVGFKFLDGDKEPRIVRYRGRAALCQALKIAGITGRAVLLDSENSLTCLIGRYIAGLGELPESLEKRWIEYASYTREIYESLIKGAERVEGKKAFLAAPLKRFDSYGFDPDGVFLAVNSAQAYLLVVSLFDSTGRRTTSRFSGHAACEAIAAVANGKTPWVTIPCGGARALAEAQDDELWLAISVDDLRTCIARLKRTGMRYPLPVYLSFYVEPPEGHRLRYLIYPEGG